MYLLKNLAFLLISYGLVMQIFRFSTYHKFFKYVFLVLMGYGALVGYLLHKFAFHDLFLWHIGFSTFFLLSKGLSQHKMTKELIKQQDNDTVTELKLSMTNTLLFFTLSSITYLGSFGFFYLYFYNR